MKYRVTFTLVMSCILQTTSLGAPLMLTEVLGSVKQHFPLIQAQQLQISQAQANLLAAKGGFDPTLRSAFVTSPVGVYHNGYSDTELSAPIKNSGARVFTGYRIGLGNFPVYQQERWTYDQGEVRGGVELPLLRDRSIDSRRAKITQSQFNLRINEEGLRLQQLNIEKQASYSYWDWVAEGKKLQVQAHMLALATTRQMFIDKRFHRGDAAEVESLDNQRLIIQRQAALAMQQQYFQKAALILSLYYRNADGKPIMPTLKEMPALSFKAVDKSTNMNKKTDLTTVVNQNPSILQLEEKRNLSYLNLSLARNSLLPKLSTKMYLAQDFGGGKPPLNRTSVNVELSFEMPLYQREARGHIAAGRKNLAQIEAEQQFLADKLKIDILNAENQINANQSLVQLMQKEVVLAEKLERAESIKYNSGDSNLFLLNVREQSSVESQIRLIDSLADFYKSIADYYFAVAKG